MSGFDIVKNMVLRTASMEIEPGTNHKVAVSQMWNTVRHLSAREVPEPLYDFVLHVHRVHHGNIGWLPDNMGLSYLGEIARVCWELFEAAPAWGDPTDYSEPSGDAAGCVDDILDHTSVGDVTEVMPYWRGESRWAVTTSAEYPGDQYEIFMNKQDAHEFAAHIKTEYGV